MSAPPLTLALDAATYAGTVAVVRGDRVLAEQAVAMRGAHSERLMPAVAAALAEAGCTVADLERVVCGAGPGSFTSLRIAAGIAKGVALGRGIPLCAVPSPLLMVAGLRELPASGRYLALLDAMRGEVFATPVEVTSEGRLRAAPTVLVGEPDVAALAERLAATPLGAGRTVESAPHARGVARLDEPLRAVDLAGWEPTYGRLAEAQVKWEAAHGRALPER